MKYQRVMQRGVVIVCYLVVLIALLEVTVRLYGIYKGIDFSLYHKELINSERVPKEIFQSDPVRRLKPHAAGLATTSDFSVRYTINSKGLRDAECAYQKKEGTIRIMALGDSLTFGEGVPYGRRFTEVIEKEHKNIEVINCGVPGFALDQMLSFFLTEGVNYEPDCVIVFLHKRLVFRYALDILPEDQRMFADLRAAARSAREKQLSRAAHARASLRSRQSVLYRLHVFALLAYQYKVWVLKKEMIEADKQFWTSYNSAVTTEKQHAVYELCFTRADMILDALVENASGKSIQVLIVNIDPDNRYLEHLRARDGLVYDLSDALQKYAKINRLYFTYDQHYNGATHNYIGQKLSAIISGSVVRNNDRETHHR